MDDYSMPVLLVAALPTVVAIIVYFVRIEIKMASLAKDICMLYKEVAKCPRRSEDHTP